MHIKRCRSQEKCAKQDKPSIKYPYKGASHVNRTSEIKNKIGQMFVVGFHGTTINDDVRKLIHEYRVGSFILFSRNIGTPEEVKQLTSSLQEEARKAGHAQPLLICLDQENGVVRRLKDPTTIFPGPMSLGAIDDLELSEQVGLATGRELKELGINWNLAPVVDVNNNPKNPVINVRSFGENPQNVASLSTKWFKGLQQAGVASTLKHFPGHGDTDVDSHLDLPVIHHSLDRLFEVELVPFIEGIKQGTDVIMSAHIYFSALEKEFGKSATLSHEVLTGLLRERLGFNGVITTDCLEMNAILNTVGVAKGTVEAVKAGADYTMISHTIERQVSGIEALIQAVETGEISEKRIQDSYQRIMDLKNRYAGSWEALHSMGTSYVGCVAHQKLAQTTYQKSVCVVRDAIQSLDAGKPTIVVYPQSMATNQAEDKQEHSPVQLALETYDLALIPHAVGEEETVEITDPLDQVIVFAYSLSQEDSYFKAIEPLVKKTNAVLIALRGPYPVQEFDGDVQAICVYDDSPNAIHSSLDVVFGKSKATGKLPVSIEE